MEKHPEKGRILLMDDEEIILKTTSILLRRMGYEVDSSRNGEEALEYYRRSLDDGRPYDAVIMDLTIPRGMGGRKAAIRLREMDPDVRTIATSGHLDDLDPVREGFTAAIAKPYRIDELSALIRMVIGRKL